MRYGCRGAGVPETLLQDLAERVARDKSGISKFETARTVLTRLNETGDAMLAPRREILKRIVETESFEHCWPEDRMHAKGVVAEIQKVVGTKDSFTRMKAERDRERETHLSAKRKEQEERERQRKARANVKNDLFALFGEEDSWKRGKQLESVLNRLFALDGLSVREAFHLNGDEAEGIVEQIDGVIDLDGQLYLVEMKWLNEKVSPETLGYHHSRVFLRHAASGMFISASGFTDPAIAHAKLALTRMVSVLCVLEEIVLLLERDDVDVRRGLELPDPPPSLAQLLPLGRAQARQLAPVDQLLPPPAVNRLVADLEQPRHLPHRLARRDQIQRPPTELRRIAPPSHCDLLSRPPESRNRTLRNRGWTNSTVSVGDGDTTLEGQTQQDDIRNRVSRRRPSLSKQSDTATARA